MTTNLLTPEHVAAQLRITTDELEQRRRARRSPAWIRLSARTIRYHPADVHDVAG